MKKIIFISLLFFFIGFPVLANNAQKSYLITILFNRGQAIISDDVFISNAVPSSIEPENQMGRHRFFIEVLSIQGKILFEKEFSINNEMAHENPDEFGVESIVMEKEEHLEIIPYFKEGVKLLLFDINHRLIDQKDISNLAEICGDGECADYESYLTCKDDCRADAADGYCNKMLTDSDPDCVKIVKKDMKEVTEIKSSLNYKLILLFILSIGLLVALVVYYFIHKKNINKF